MPTTAYGSEAPRPLRCLLSSFSACFAAAPIDSRPLVVAGINLLSRYSLHIGTHGDRLARALLLIV